MANWTIRRRAELYGNGSANAGIARGYVGDAKAHTWVAEITENGAPAVLTGYTAVANVRRGDGMIVQPGTISGNRVTVTLPQTTYAYAGTILAVLRLVNASAGINLVVDAVEIEVVDTGSGTVIDPGHVVPTINDLLARIGDMASATAAANAAATAANSYVNSVTAAMVPTTGGGNVQAKINDFAAQLALSWKNMGPLADGADLNNVGVVGVNSVHLLASSRTYLNMPPGVKEGFLYTTGYGSTSTIITHMVRELTTGEWRYRRQIGGVWGPWQPDTLKIAMFGDSITWGSVAGVKIEKGMPYWVQRRLGHQVANFGVGSQGWLAVAGGKNALDHIKSTDLTGYDVITLQYGINDWNKPLGAYTDTTPGTSIMGSIYEAYRYLAETYPLAVVILIAPTNTSDNGSFPKYRLAVRLQGGYTGQEMIDEYRKFANHYGVPFIDHLNSPMTAFTITSLLGDHVHPNANGYKVLGLYLAGQIAKIISK